MSDGNTSRVSQRLHSSRNTISGTGDQPLSRHLRYKLPFDWETALGVFRAHQLPHLESVDDRVYERVVKTSLGMGWFRVQHDAEGSFVCVSLWGGADEDLDNIAMIVRRMFDLDADPAAIAKVFDGDQYLSAIWARYPGLRVARSWDGFESMLTTILGQLVSVSFGRTLTGELMQTAGAKARHPKTGERIHLFPTAKKLLSADLKTIRTSEAQETRFALSRKLFTMERFSGSPSSHRKNCAKSCFPFQGSGRGLLSTSRCAAFMIMTPSRQRTTD
jgi:AlkA N-terminal domain